MSRNNCISLVQKCVYINIFTSIAAIVFAVNAYASAVDYIDSYTLRREFKTLEIDSGLQPGHPMVIPRLHYENKLGGKVQDTLRDEQTRIDVYARSFSSYALSRSAEEDAQFLSTVKSTLGIIGASADVTTKMVDTLGIVARGADAATKSKILDTLKATYNSKAVGVIEGSANVVNDLSAISDKVIFFADIMLEAKKASDRSRDQEITLLESMKDRIKSSNVPDLAALAGIEKALEELEKDKTYAKSVVDELQERKYELADMVLKHGVEAKIGTMASANVSAYIAGTVSVSTLGAGFLLSSAAVVAKDGISSWSAGERFKELEKQACSLANLDRYLRKTDPKWDDSLDQYKLAHAYLSVQLSMAKIHEDEMGKMEKWTGSFDPSVIEYLENDLDYLSKMIALIESNEAIISGELNNGIILPGSEEWSDQSAHRSGSASSGPDIGDIYIDSNVGDVTVINKTRRDLEVNVHSVEATGRAKSGDITIQSSKGNDITVIKKRRKDKSEVNIGSVRLED